MASNTSPPPADLGSPVPGPSALAFPVPAGMRDLLPPAAYRHAELGRRLVRTFELSGYELVTVPLFEFAEVVERGLGGLEASEVLRFVEPESGAVVSLRPDMTPQVARLVATRLSQAPSPARLCYQGSVLRRRHERARRHRQIPQAGIELVGCEGPDGDLEVLSTAVQALRVAGLTEFVIDIGHAKIASALVESLSAAHTRDVLDALEIKDETEVVRRAERHGLKGRDLAALSELPWLHGGEELWPRAERVLTGTLAAPYLAELKRLWQGASELGLSRQVLADLGETRDFAYYTGALFQIHAEGPGRPLGAGGRYDNLLERFGAPRHAVGFAFGLDDVAWALEAAGRLPSLPRRVLLGTGASSLAGVLRDAGIAAASAPESDLLAYARAWRYSHVLQATPTGFELLDAESAQRSSVPAEPAALITEILARLGVGSGVIGKDGPCRQ